MELRAGYKLTDIGFFPVDWIEDTLGGVIKLLTDFTANGSFASLAKNVKYLNKPDYARLIRLTDIRVNFQNDGIYISKEAYEFLSKSKLFGDELLLANVGAYTGYSFLYPKGLLFRGSLAPNMFLIKFDYIKLNPKFVYYSFTYTSVFKQLLEKSASSAQPKLNKQNVRECIFNYPPTLAEQTAIATALSDADALINSLSTLIAKKRNIKQGAMQQLLKPKEGWEVKKLGNIGKPYGGLSGKSKLDFADGKFPYIPFMNIMSNPIIDTSYVDYVNIGVDENQNKALKGDLFFNGSSETPEEVGMCSVLLEDIPNLYLNSFCFGFRLNKDSKENGLYLSYYFRSSEGRKLFYSMAQGATRYNLSKSNFNKMEVSLPKPEEQIEIANILSDMDAEIQALESKLEKYRQIKLGMMQVLLTGKVRLI